MSDEITAANVPSAGRNAPVEFGWRMPMWDPDKAPATTWMPHVHATLGAIEGHYESVWLSDHLVPGAGWMSPEPDTLECWAATCYLAGQHRSFKYGQIVMGNSYRHPPMLAKSASTLQTLSGGRLILGIGAGWMESEYRMYGYPYPKPSVRIEQLDEAVQIIRLIWSRSPATFKGKYFEIDEAHCNPLPSPPPPLLIGAAGEKLSLRVVARHADWWDYSGVNASEYARKAGVLAEHCDAVGRDPTSILFTTQVQVVSIADSRAEADRTAEGTTLHQNSNKAAAMIGTPEDVTQRVADLVGVGVRHVIVRFADFPRTEMALRFAREIAPRFRGAVSRG